VTLATRQGPQEGLTAGEKAIGEDAQGVDVGGGGRDAASEPLGRHVEGRACELAALGQPVPPGEGGGGCGAIRRIAFGLGRDQGDEAERALLALFVVDRAKSPHRPSGGGSAAGGLAPQQREAEVQQLHALPGRVRLGQEHVLRLQVAMEDAALVREVDRLGDGIEDGQGLGEGKGSRTGRVGLEGDAVEELRHEVGDSPSPGIDTGVGHVDDVRVLQLSQGLGFHSEAREQSRTPLALRWISRRDRATPSCARVDDAHPAFPRRLEPESEVEGAGQRCLQHGPVRRAAFGAVLVAGRAETALLHLSGIDAGHHAGHKPATATTFWGEQSTANIRPQWGNVKASSNRRHPTGVINRRLSFARPSSRGARGRRP
jgi:hypothetical protein